MLGRLILSWYSRSRTCSEDNHNIALSAPLALIMKIPTRVNTPYNIPWFVRLYEEIIHELSECIIFRTGEPNKS